MLRSPGWCSAHAPGGEATAKPLFVDAAILWVDGDAPLAMQIYDLSIRVQHEFSFAGLERIW